MHLACPKCHKEIKVRNAWDFEEVYCCQACGANSKLRYDESFDGEEEYQYWWLEKI